MAKTITSLLDRPIAFQRAFVDLGIGITGALLLSQAVYWANRTDDEDGWFYKTQDEWQSETGLTRTEQETARRRLIALGVMSEERRGIPARLFFRLNEEVLVSQLTLAVGCNLDCGKAAINSEEKPPASKRKSSKPARKISARRTAQKSQSNIDKTTSESTTETTAETLTAGVDTPAEPMIVTAANGTIYKIPADLKYPGPHTKSHKTWIAYAIAYQQRYNSWPLWNETVGGQITKFISRVGADLAPRVAVHYVRRVNETFIVKEFHSIGLLLQNAEKWATQFQTGATMTNVQARLTDQKSSNFDAIEEAKRMTRERILGSGGGNA